MTDYQRLVNFFGKYRNHSRLSSDCRLESDYFWQILGFYPGLIQSPLEVIIIAKSKFDLNFDGLEFEVFTSINSEHMLATKNSNTRYRILKVNIMINQSQVCSLIYIDTQRKIIYHYHVIYDSPIDMFDNNPVYLGVVNATLQKFLVGNGQGILPDYTYEVVDDYVSKDPTLIESDSCELSNLCSAFILRRAMSVIANNTNINATSNENNSSNNYGQILRFIDAIRLEYGSSNRSQYGTNGFVASGGAFAGNTFAAGFVKTTSNPHNSGFTSTLAWNPNKTTTNNAISTDKITNKRSGPEYGRPNYVLTPTSETTTSETTTSEADTSAATRFNVKNTPNVIYRIKLYDGLDSNSTLKDYQTFFSNHVSPPRAAYESAHIKQREFETLMNSQSRVQFGSNHNAYTDHDNSNNGTKDNIYRRFKHSRYYPKNWSPNERYFSTIILAHSSSPFILAGGFNGIIRTSVLDI